MFQRTTDNYLDELLDIREKLKDFVQRVSEGKFTYYKDISVKLRILYCSKSDTDALWKTIQDLFSFDILVLIMYSAKEQVEHKLVPASLAEGLVFEQVNSVLSWFERGDELINILDAINRDEVFISNKHYSYKH